MRAGNGFLGLHHLYRIGDPALESGRGTARSVWSARAMLLCATVDFLFRGFQIQQRGANVRINLRAKIIQIVRGSASRRASASSTSPCTLPP